MIFSSKVFSVLRYNRVKPTRLLIQMTDKKDLNDSLNQITLSSASNSATQIETNSTRNTIYWFRKALRLHDNPSLVHAIENSDLVYPVFVLDPWFVRNARVGPNRWRFLIQTLNDLHQSLQKKNSGLILLKGSPHKVFPEKFKEWNISVLCFEKDTEPYAKQRDAEITKLAGEHNVRVETKWGHTLYNPDYLYEKNGKKVTLTYQSFTGLLGKVGDPPKPLPEPKVQLKKLEKVNFNDHKVPDLDELGVDLTECAPCKFPGGETEALRRMADKLSNEAWVCNFEKPMTSPNSLEPSTTVLSPYLKFGSLSARLFYYKLKECYSKRKHSQPPVSLHGQLIWREFFNFVGHFTPNFDKMEGNAICRQINWEENEEFLKAWRNGRTGYPFVDAIMNQLRLEGWIHHLARHMVACFLTRGDLYQSWVKGQEVFEGNRGYFL
jgi:cryptochrome